MTQLEERIQREKFQHDHGNVVEENRKLKARFSHVFAGPNFRYGMQVCEKHILESVRNGVVLDYGCGEGAAAPRYAAAGASSIFGIDVSERAISSARKNFGALAQFAVMDAHRTSFPDKMFDAVIGTAILHHLEFDLAVREISRVLKPGGKAIFYEPLGQNPFAKVFRWLTPKARTPDERPLDRRDVEAANRLFARSEHCFMNLVSTPVGMISSVLSDNPDNIFMSVSDRIDRSLQTSAVRWWMRAVVLVWTK